MRMTVAQSAPEPRRPNSKKDQKRLREQQATRAHREHRTARVSRQGSIPLHSARLSQVFTYARTRQGRAEAGCPDPKTDEQLGNPTAVVGFCLCRRGGPFRRGLSQQQPTQCNDSLCHCMKVLRCASFLTHGSAAEQQIKRFNPPGPCVPRTKQRAGTRRPGMHSPPRHALNEINNAKNTTTTTPYLVG